MPAYLVAEIEVLDPERYGRYHPLAVSAIGRYGGRVLAGSDGMAALEGVGSASRWVIVEFDTFEQGQRFHGSPEYQAATAVRGDSAIIRMVLLRSVEEGRP